MSRRKGELSKGSIDLQWPHQVALPERLCSREHWRAQHDFCQQENLSGAPRGHRFLRNEEWWLVKCFADRSDADRFMERFGGEYMTPATRPR